MSTNVKFDLPMVDDEIYVNDGESFDSGNFYPEEGEERKEAETKENESLAASVPILKANAEWFSDAVNSCDNLDNVLLKEITLPDGQKFSRTVSIEAQVLAYQLLKSKLMEKAQEYADFMGDKV